MVEENNRKPIILRFFQEKSLRLHGQKLLMIIVYQ